MSFDRNSGRGWRRLALICIIAAIVLSPWLHWAALALAGLGLAISAPVWLGRSWRSLLEFLVGRLGLTGMMLSRSADHAPSMDKGKEKERLPLHERSARHAASESSVGRAPEASAEAIAHRPIPTHTWSLQAHTRETPTEAVVRPQSCLRLAAEGVAAGQGREKPDSPVGAEEVIDLPSILGNLGRRYRGKEPAGSAGRAQVSEPHSTKDSPVTVDAKEIRRQLLATYGRRLAGSGRHASSGPDGESPRGAIPAIPGSRNGHVDPPAARQVVPAGPTKAAGMPTGELTQGWRPAANPGSSPERAIETAGRGPQERLSGQVVEPTALPQSVAPFSRALLQGGSGMEMTGASYRLPARTVPSGELRTGDTQDTSAPVRQRKPFVEPYAPLRPVVPSEAPPRPLSAEPVVLTRPPAIDLSAGGTMPGGLSAAGAAADSRRHSFRPGFNEDMCLPPLSLLHPASSAVPQMSQDDLIEVGILIEEKLAEFRVKVNIQDAVAGPVITRYEVQPAVGVRGGQVVSLMKDLARALGVAAIRVVETIPGKTCMGLELPNSRRQMIHLSEVLSTELFQSHSSKLAMALGKDITGEPVVADLARAPHMLVAGTTGSGKSVGVNAMILSLLYRATPDDVRFVMIDPKMLELSIYDGIPHLLAPVVTDMKLAANALTWCVGEMERRYRLMSGLRVRNLASYNQKLGDAIDAGVPLIDPFSLLQGNPVPLSPLPYIVVVVDELADLMIVAGKKIEELIARLAQKARAAGIHLIIATQRPSVDVITGLIKANIPTRIAFQVSSKIDSRTILDQMGAECLLGQGDMLYLPPGTGYPQRVHGAFVADEEVHAVAEHLKQFGEPQYVEGVLRGAADADEGTTEPERFGDDADPLYDDAVAFVISSRRASISAVQRHLRIGYNRAARLVEQMEASGLVSPMESNGNRTILVPARED